MSIYKVVFETRAPLSHGDPAMNEDTGNFRALRKQHIVGVGKVPVLAGNAIRGVMRRIVMRDFLSRAGMTRDAYRASPGHWDRIYAALANGGALTGAEQAVHTEKLRALRAAVPPLSLFGAALYTRMLPGMCAVLDAYPQCRQVAAAGLCDASELDLGSLYGDRNHVRHVSAEVDREAAGITPMPYTHEVLFPGVKLQGGVIVDKHATELERDCLQWTLGQVEQLGGNTSKGFGVVVSRLPGDLGDASRYETWVAANAAAARPIIEEAISARGVSV